MDWDARFCNSIEYKFWKDKTTSQLSSPNLPLLCDDWVADFTVNEYSKEEQAELKRRWADLHHVYKINEHFQKIF